MYKDHLINALDTPGHADFGGEVERVLGMVDGTVLLVDATEGPLAQTKFVLEKALKKGFKPIVVLNKVDRESATPERCGAVESQLFDLFASLGATDEQLDFTVLYASAKQGWATRTLPIGGQAPPNASMEPLLDAILKVIGPPPAPLDLPFSMTVSMIERDSYIGRIATGRVATGSAKLGDKVRVLHHDGRVSEDCKVLKVMKRVGQDKVYLDEAIAGDVVSIAGVPLAGIADTIASPLVTKALDPGRIDPPTLSMVFGTNDSPLAGRSGKAVTGRAIGERLMAEAETSVSLRVTSLSGSGEKYEVQARGELQLGILIENMRREGMELAVSPPQVLIKVEDGVTMEPLEEVMCEVTDEAAGQVIMSLGLRKAELTEMLPIAAGKQRLTFVMPSRGMIGFKTVFVNITRGEGLMSRAFLRYDKHRGPMDLRGKGVLVCTAEGKATRDALGDLQQRGIFFIEPGADLYGGMVVGENTRDQDLDVNPSKKKVVSNVRCVEADEKIFLAAPRIMNLEDAIGYVAADELIEVTPSAVRLRKAILDPTLRKNHARKMQNQGR
ncbi:MAG: hypothetical protein WDW36_002418 [Sanguina aurantia]